MADETRQCFLAKFTNSVPVGEIKKVFPCLRHGILAVQYKDDYVHLIDVRTNPVRFSESENLSFKLKIRKFIWSSQQRITATFLVVTHHWQFALYSVNGYNIVKDVEAKITDLKSLEDLQTESPEDVQLLGFNGEVLSFLFKAELFVLKAKEGRFMFMSRSSVVGDLTCPQVINSTLVTYKAKAGIFSFYDISSGDEQSVINMKQIIPENSSVKSWKFSSDLQSLCFVDESFALFDISISAYLENNPGCLKLESADKKTDVCSFTSSHTGDVVWREKLSSIYKSQAQSSQKPSWHKKRSGHEKKMQQFKHERGKQSRLTGFFRENEADSSSDSFIEAKIALPKDELCKSENLCQNMTVSHKSVCFLCIIKGEKSLYFCDLQTGKISCESLDIACHAVLCSGLSDPHVIVTETHLLCIVTHLHLQQEDFVSRIMMYAGASIADTVCHINKWGRCSVPLHTLDIGLKQRQLDTVSFFLKSKESAFIPSEIEMPQSPSPLTSVLSYHDNFVQLEPALQLLIQAMGDLEDRPSQQFVKKIADITLEFLYSLLHRAIDLKQRESISEKEDDFKKASERILVFIAKVRACVRLLDQPQSVGKKSASLREGNETPSDSHTTASITFSGSHMQETMEQGVHENRVLQLQSYLIQSGSPHKATYDNIYHTSMERVLQYLAKSHCEPAIVILINLGLEVDEKLWEIASLTENGETRSYIVSEMESRGTLSEMQRKDVQFTERLETLLKKNTKSEPERDQRNYQVEETIKSLSEKGQTMSSDAMETDSGQGHTSVLLDWVGHWDEQTRELVLYQTSKNCADSQYTLTPTLYAQYLLCYNRLPEIREWLRETGRTEDHPHVLQEILDRLGDCTGYVRQIVTRECAQFSILTKTSDFHKMLHLLHNMGGALVKPHPLSLVESHIYPVSHFHEDFLKYCVQRDLPSLAWHYSNIHGLTSEVLHHILDSLEEKSWFKMFLFLYCLIRTPSDPEIMYQASLANEEHMAMVMVPSTGDNGSQGQINPMISTIMYSSRCLQEIMDGENPHLSLMDLKSAVLPYPKLHEALFPSSSRETPRTDITVYDLLKNNAIFDPSQLFSWQSTNAVFSGEDRQQQMPHFAHSELMARYGYTERLRYTYYLKQARPSFAFLAFISEEKESDVEISAHRISEAKNTALWLGVQNFHNGAISCACVVFIEMFGESSLVLRTMLQVGQEVLIYLNDQLTGSTEQRKEQGKENEDKIVSWLCSCLVYRKKHSLFLQQQLESAIEHCLAKDKIKATSFDAGQKWTIVVLFCKQLQLPLTTKFLETCAREDKWLPFLWFAQLHQYSKEQLQSLLYKFRSRHLQQHLHYVIENAESRAMQSQTTVPEGQSQTVPSRKKDVRSSLYSRIGLTKDQDQNESSDEEDKDSVAKETHDVEENFDHILDVDKAAIPDDFFQVVFAAQGSKCPWKTFILYGVTLRNPLLTELAYCAKEVPLLPCLCAWLVAMMSEEHHGKFLKNYGKYLWKWNLKHLGFVIDIYLQQSWMSTLSKGFAIFQPTSPLLPFLRFTATQFETRDYSGSKTHLEEFKEAMSQFTNGELVETEVPVVGSSDWLQQTTYRIIQFYFHHTKNQYDLLQLLRILDTQNIILIFKFDVPDFGQLARLLQIIVSVQNIDVDFSALVSSEAARFEEASEGVVHQLIQRGMFQEARKFASESGTSTDKVTEQEVIFKKKRLMETSLWRSSEAKKKFWRESEEIFASHNVSPETVTSFFQREGEETEDLEEKSYIYGLGLHNLEREERGDHTELMNKLYRELWLTRIKQMSLQMQDDTEENTQLTLTLTQRITSIPKQELLCYGKMPKADAVTSDLSVSEKTAAIHLVDTMLDRGEIINSCRLVAEFGFYNRNLAIILTCIRLSLGAVSVSELEPTMLTLLTSNIGKLNRPVLPSISSSSSLLNMPTTSTLTDILPVEKGKTLVTMETLLGFCSHGNHCCKRVINCYLIAVILGQDYQEVIEGQEFDILKSLLMTSFQERFRLAAEYLTSSPLSTSQIAQFLCDSIVETYKVRYANLAGESMNKEAVNFDAEAVSPETSDFIKLTANPSLLGDKLLDTVPSLSEVEGEEPQYVFAIKTELLILAHMCHTSACNMEGISNVLKAAKTLAASLQDTSHFQLMVRLLTGIGRFNEMTYIFDSLKQNDRFELLLRKGIEKERNLKIAMLDYLKRFHPGDEETFDMVAHNFVMHREIAQLLERKAKKLLDKYKDSALDTSQDTFDSLQSVTQFYMDAAESYYKDGCIRHAQVCMSHARLVALQLQSLPTGLKVIHLTPEGADQFISSHTKFSEALIVSESYTRKGCWTDALCNNVLIAGDFRYLQDFKTYYKLPPTLIPEIFEKFNSNPNKMNYIHNVRKLLAHCNDVGLQLRLAREFDLKDVIQTLQKKDGGNFIRDLMATE